MEVIPQYKVIGLHNYDRVNITLYTATVTCSYIYLPA